MPAVAIEHDTSATTIESEFDAFYPSRINSITFERESHRNVTDANQGPLSISRESSDGEASISMKLATWPKGCERLTGAVRLNVPVLWRLHAVKKDPLANCWRA